MSYQKNICLKWVLRTFAALFVPASMLHAASVVDLGMTPGSTADQTDILQRILDEGPSQLTFPDGYYRIGTVEVPANRTLSFHPGAMIRPMPDRIEDKKLFVVVGDNVHFEGLNYDFAWNGAGMHDTPVNKLVYAHGVNDLTVSGARVKNSDERELIPLAERRRRGRFMNYNGTNPTENYSHKGYYNSQVLLYVESGSNIVLENSASSRLHGMLETYGTSNVICRGNTMTSGNYMVRFAEGGESFRHTDNWSRDVKYQAVWFGGSPDPSRKKYLPRGSSSVVYRDIKSDMPDYNKHTSGAYDVLIQNNYAEYGNTLCWGNKGRQVVIDGNVARFIGDYAYGSEGGENLVFSNNVSINSTAGGIASMYWGEKLLITGNMIITRHEPWDPEWSWWDDPSKYLGPFVRLHHGPSNPEDHYGAGSVEISGNLFVNELSQRTTALTVQAGRDVRVSDNKFINGSINKFGEGRMTIMNNEFISRLDFDPATIIIKPIDVNAALIKGNIFRKEAAIKGGDEEQKRAELNKVPYFAFTGDDNVGMEAEETNSVSDGPAIQLGVAGPFFGLIEDNFIYGWEQAVDTEVRPNADEVSLVIQKNSTDGTVEVNDLSKRASLQMDSNTKLPAGMMR